MAFIYQIKSTTLEAKRQGPPRTALPISSPVCTQVFNGHSQAPGFFLHMLSLPLGVSFSSWRAWQSY